MISKEVKKLIVKTGIAVLISSSVIGLDSINLNPNLDKNITKVYAEEKSSEIQTTTNNLNSGKLPSTGQDSVIYIVGAAVILLIVGVVLVIIKKKEEEK